MWLYIRTELDRNRYLLGISLVVAILFSFFVITGGDGEREIDARHTAWIYLNAYIVCLIIWFVSHSEERRERLYTQLPLTRTQIALGDLNVWLIWTMLFYAVSCLTPLIGRIPIEPGYSIKMLSNYLSIMGVAALIGIAFILTNFRNRYWQIGYIVLTIFAFAVIMGNEITLISVVSSYQLIVLGYPVDYLVFSSLFAICSVGTMYLIYMRQDYYLK